MSTVPQISIPDVLAALAEGKSRFEIGQSYGLNKAQTKRLFSEPELKGKKVKKAKQPAFIVVRGDNATAPAVAEVAAPAVADTPQESEGW